jgi:thiamine-phosphate pyrophosphorylase
VVTDPLSPKSEDAPLQTPGGGETRIVALRGLKRAQEALRVIEEFLRGHFSETSAKLAGYRYSAYEAEQWLVCASPAMEIVAASSIYVLLTEKLCKRSLFETAREVLEGGVRLLQIREKELKDIVLFARVRDLLSLTKDYGAVLICNDNIALAMSTGSAGVHLGQDDLPPHAARRVSGERLLIGRSTHSKQEALKAVNEEGVDYVAIGSMYDTATKPERQLSGLSLAEEVSALKLDVPVFAIGGITAERIGELKKCGVRRFAVSSAIISAPDPRSAARRMIEAAGG